MKIFLDTAKIEDIKEAASWGIIDGITTNPTLVSREGKDFHAAIKEIAGIVDGPISAEVLSLKTEGMVEEAETLANIHKNIVIKIPITVNGLKAIKILKEKRIRTNTTLVFSANQALLAAKAGTSYVSPFIGRLDDIGQVGMELVRQIKQIFTNYKFSAEIIVASVRHPIHVLESALLGADIATVPFKVAEWLVKHPLTDKGIERFLADWKRQEK